MRALHIVTENPSKNNEYPVISESKLEAAYVQYEVKALPAA